jgi:hypothetical protein
MAKFHINKHGVPAPCKAQKGNCPYGGEESHYNSQEEAQIAIDQINEEEYGVLGGLKKADNVVLELKKMANEELLQITIANARSVGTGYNEEIEEFIRIAKEELLERMSK